MIQPPLIAVLLLAQVLAQPPCTVPAGPPCVPHNDPRLERCELSVGTCFFVLWEEVGSVVVTHASMAIYPTCGDGPSAARLERAGRDHLASLQSIPIEIVVTVKACKQRQGYMDLTIEEISEEP